MPLKDYESIIGISKIQQRKKNQIETLKNDFSSVPLEKETFEIKMCRYQKYFWPSLTTKIPMREQKEF